MIVQKLFYSCSRKPLCEAKRMRKELLKSNPLHVHNFRLYQRFTSSSSNQNSLSGATEGNVEEVYDLIVVGGGIVGVTTARAMLIEKPNLRVAILEKEKDVAMHQSSHNSGVIHAGIYYRPGSLRAKLCVEGARQTYAFCDEHKIPYKKCGKLIVATTKEEEQNLFILYNYALKNGLDEVQSIDSDKIPEIEPFCQGIKAIYSPNTGIIDWGIFTKYCASDFQKRGGNLRCNFKVTKVKEAEKGSNCVDVSEAPLEFYDETRGKKIRSKYAIMCGGLYSDKLASLIDGVPLPVIVPFRGEYLELKEEKRHLIKGNIYPVPNPNFPFLGVHFTPRLDGRVLVGPNAILAFSREGYRWDQINKEELMEVFKFQGFRKLLSDYAIYGVKEALKSWIIQLRVKDLRKYIPSIKSSDLEFRGFTGVRAQALDEDGSLVEDMVLQIGSKGIESRILHCRNAPSPSATSSLALSEFIAKSAIVEFDFDA